MPRSITTAEYFYSQLYSPDSADGLTLDQLLIYLPEFLCLTEDQRDALFTSIIIEEVIFYVVYIETCISNNINVKMELWSNKTNIKAEFFLLHCMLVQDEKDVVNETCILLYKNKCCQNLENYIIWRAISYYTLEISWNNVMSLEIICWFVYEICIDYTASKGAIVFDINVETQ